MNYPPQAEAIGRGYVFGTPSVNWRTPL